MRDPLRYFATAMAILAVDATVPGEIRAQEPGWEVSPSLCVVAANERLEGRIVASCRGQGLILGRADSFRVIENRQLEAMVIDLVRDGERRVLMISFPDDEPLLEDITGTLAKAAGRGPMSSIEGVEIELGGFEQDSRIAVRSPPEAGRGIARTSEVDLGQGLATEAARRAEARVRN